LRRSGIFMGDLAQWLAAVCEASLHLSVAAVMLVRRTTFYIEFAVMERSLCDKSWHPQQLGVLAPT
jgi:hypothetical protein